MLRSGILKTDTSCLLTCANCRNVRQSYRLRGGFDSPPRFLHYREGDTHRGRTGCKNLSRPSRIDDSFPFFFFSLDQGSRLGFARKRGNLKIGIGNFCFSVFFFLSAMLYEICGIASEVENRKLKNWVVEITMRSSTDPTSFCSRKRETRLFVQFPGRN